MRNSQAESVYRALRDEIIRCRRTPGARLPINEICRENGVSLGGAREALSRLVADGLVVSEPQKGFRVVPLSADDLSELTLARVEIECLALRRSIELGDVDWEANLLAAFHRMQKKAKLTEKDELSAEWALIHAAFHEALVVACDNRWLLRLRRMLFEQSERYRYFSASTVDRPRDIDGEHTEILNAALAHDPDGASAALRRHLMRTRDDATQKLSEVANIAAPSPIE